MLVSLIYKCPDMDFTISFPIQIPLRIFLDINAFNFTHIVTSIYEFAYKIQPKPSLNTLAKTISQVH